VGIKVGGLGGPQSLDPLEGLNASVEREQREARERTTNRTTQWSCVSECDHKVITARGVCRVIKTV
jgi:hypothetical protein